MTRSPLKSPVTDGMDASSFVVALMLPPPWHIMMPSGGCVDSVGYDKPAPSCAKFWNESACGMLEISTVHDPYQYNNIN